MGEEKQTREIVIASCVAPALCLALMFVIKNGNFTNYYDTIRLFTLSVTSMVIVIIYLIGVRRYLSFCKKQGGVDSEQDN